MKRISKREGKGFEIVCYYPKKNGQYTANTGNQSRVFQTDSVEEVAEWFASRAWGRVFEDSDIAMPTVYLNGVRCPSRRDALN